MTGERRFRISWLLWSLVAFGLVALLGRRYLSQREFAQRLQQSAERLGLQIEIGRTRHGLSATRLENVKLRFANAIGINADLDAVTVRGSFIGNPEVRLGKVHFDLTGEPSDLHAGLSSLPRLKELPVTLGDVSATYSHRVFGRVTFEGLTVEPGDGTSVVRANQVVVGQSRWQNVVFCLQRRNQMIELGLGETSVKAASVQLGYFLSTRGATQWTLTAAHQPARTLARKLGWDPGSAFEEAFIVGSLSFVVPDDPTLKVRGSMQWAMDRWPKPGWAESEALLGNTLSFVGRIEPSDDMTLWNLPNVEVSLSIFSMTGVARIRLGRDPAFLLDVRGERNCAQLHAHLPDSSFAQHVKEYVERDLAGATIERQTKLVQRQRANEELQLRLQFLFEPTDEKRHLAWQLSQGCGLQPLATGTFTTLDLPEFVGKKRR